MLKKLFSITALCIFIFTTTASAKALEPGATVNVDNNGSITTTVVTTDQVESIGRNFFALDGTHCQIHITNTYIVTPASKTKQFTSGKMLDNCLLVLSSLRDRTWGTLSIATANIVLPAGSVMSSYTINPPHMYVDPNDGLSKYDVDIVLIIDSATAGGQASLLDDGEGAIWYNF